MNDMIIIGIYLKEGHKNGPQLQEILTKYGNVIKTRLGLNDLDDSGTSFGGLIILELFGDQLECSRLENELIRLENVKVDKMTFPRK